MLICSITIVRLLQLRNISMLDIRPFLDVVEIHNPIWSAKSPQSVSPVPVFGNFWIPLQYFMDLRGNLPFHGVDDDIANRREVFET